MEVKQFKDPDRMKLCKCAVGIGIIFYWTSSAESVFQVSEIFDDPQHREVVVYEEINLRPRRQHSIYMEDMVDRLYFGDCQIIDVNHTDTMYEQLRDRRKMLQEKVNKIPVDEITTKVRMYQSKFISDKYDNLQTKVNDFCRSRSLDTDGFKVESINLYEFPRDANTNPMMKCEDRVIINYSYLVDPIEESKKPSYSTVR